MSRTGQHTEPFAPSLSDALASIKACVLVLLASSEALGPDSPAVIAFTRAIRRFGEQAYAIGGTEALEDMRLCLVDEAPEHATARRVMLAAAWSGFTEE